MQDSFCGKKVSFYKLKYYLQPRLVLVICFPTTSRAQFTCLAAVFFVTELFVHKSYLVGVV